MSKQERIAIDLRRWQGKTKKEVVQDLAAFPIESANSPLKERVNVTALPLIDFARLIIAGSEDSENVATEKIFQWALDTTPYINLLASSAHPTESEILDQMVDFIDFNPGEIILWISPAEEGVYKEGRLGIYQVISVNGEKYLFFRSLCGNKENFNYQNISYKYQTYSKEILLSEKEADPQKARSNPLVVKIPGNSLLDLLEKIIDDIPEVWEKIRQGKDISAKKESIGIALELLSDHAFREIQQAYTFPRQVEIGRYLERELEERLNITLKLGSCGTLYSSLALTPFYSPLLGSFYAYHGEGTKRKHCGKCGKHGYFTEGESCPYDQSSRN